MISWTNFVSKLKPTRKVTGEAMNAALAARTCTLASAFAD